MIKRQAERKSSSKRRKKTQVFQPIEEDSEAEPGPTTQAHREGQKDDTEEDPKDLDKKVP